MKVPNKDKQLLQDKIDLVLKVNYSSSIFAIAFGIACIYFLNIQGVIPYAFFVFAFLNLSNTFLYLKHKRLTLTYNITSLLSMAGAIVVTLFSGGIQSPFIFILAIASGTACSICAIRVSATCCDLPSMKS